jgi:hypothetical protein
MIFSPARRVARLQGAFSRIAPLKNKYRPDPKNRAG